MGTSHTGGSCPKSPTRIMDRPKEYFFFGVSSKIHLQAQRLPRILEQKVINKSSKQVTSRSSLISTRCWLYKSIHERIMKDEPLIEKEELYRIVEKAGNEALKTEKFQKMEAQDKISNIFEQFQIAFEGVCSICDIKINNKILNKKEIKYNINDLKKKLLKDK
ncbi:unnamed protein product [Rhizophagus irregularis]|nr:unnamed protein product [Rhizophagus irregularis]